MSTTPNTEKNTLNNATSEESFSVVRGAIAEIIQKIKDEYHVKDGIITSYGRYEGSPVYVAYYDQEPPNDSAFDEYGVELRAYEVHRVEKELFNLDTEMLVLRNDNEGFVHHKAMSFAEWETIAEELAKDLSM